MNSSAKVSLSIAHVKSYNLLVDYFCFVLHLCIGQFHYSIIYLSIINNCPWAI